MSVPLPPITEDQETSTSTPPSIHHSTLEPLQLSQGREAFEEAKALYESGLYIARDNPQAAVAHFLQGTSLSLLSYLLRMELMGKASDVQLLVYLEN